MSEPVKRYVVRGNTEDGKGPGFVGEVVLAYVHDAEVASLEQECERLRADLRFLAEYIAAESAGHPLPNYLAIGRFPVDVARAALSAKP